MSDKEVIDSNAGDSDLKVSAVDGKFFAVMFKYLPQKLEIDWEQFAHEMGLKNAAVAKARLYQIRKKLGLDTASSNKNGAKGTKANNTSHKVTKPRKTGKAKQVKNAVEAAADSINDGDVESDLHDGEV
ncbi:hypothetical protein F5Y07DRAFT_347672 [Xylaria sp. FL0933]|nr:hypothetical protein F5Y07DRAFT_347672 [Xylaria sp. FL0933]